MATPKNINDLLLERLAEGLDSTSKMTHALLSELKESEADFSAVKTELSILRENVKSLSEIIREGNGATSILTRIALIEQKLANIDKWLEDHVDVHQRVKSDITDLKDEFHDFVNKVEGIQKEVQALKEVQAEQERSKRQSIDREIELQHEKNKSNQKISEERQSAFIKFGVAFLLAVLGLLGGYFVKTCQGPQPPGAAPNNIVISSAIQYQPQPSPSFR